MIGREDEVRGYRERIKSCFFLVWIFMGVVTVRLFYLQIIKGQTLRKFSEANRLKKEKIFPSRGLVIDRNGKVIVDNRASFDVVVLWQYYKYSKETNQRLAQIVSMDIAELERKLDKARKGPIFQSTLIKADVTKEVVSLVEMERQNLPGVDIEATVRRRYPYGDLAAQLLGYVAEVTKEDLEKNKTGKLEQGDFVGRSGLESKYDTYIRGQNGVGYVEVDAKGRRRTPETGEQLLGFITRTEPVPGDHLHLTLDIDLQVVASMAMKSRHYYGAVVAMDPRSGEVLAWVSEPSFFPEELSGRQVESKVWQDLITNSNRPLRNRPIQDHYSPGSVFKVFLALAGLNENEISPHGSVSCSGGLPFGARTFHCWKTHGAVDLHRAIRESCDVYFYKLGNQLGVDKIAQYARAFGLGKRTEIEIDGETSGIIPDTQWKLKNFKDVWHAGETLSVAIGQGYVTVTPIQIATSFSAIANGGFVYRPYVVRKIEGKGGEIISEYQPKLNSRVSISKDALERVIEELSKVVNEPGGTAYLSGRSAKTLIAGKTGTVQVREFAQIKGIKCESLPYEQKHHGWFVGFAPKDNPQIVVAALGEHACHGASLSPVVREIVEAYLQKEKRDLAGEPS